MKMLILKILTALAILVAILCIIAAFVPTKYTIKREIAINAPTETVYNYVRFHSNQKDFNQWLQYDPNTKIELKGNADGQEGSILYFKSKNIKTGEGEWKNTRLIKNQQIDFNLQFISPYVFTAGGALYFKPQSTDKTTLLWEFKSGKNWPSNIILLFVNMDKIIGGDIEKTLKNIKLNTEKL